MRRTTFPWRAAVCAGALLLGTLPFSVPDSPTVHAQATAAAARPAVGVDAALLAGLRWRSLGPARGGRSQAVAGSAAARSNTTSAPPAADCGRRPTAAHAGGRSPTSSSSLVGRRRRRLRVQPRHRLRRHGRDRAARQHHPGRRRLQVRPTPARPGRTSGSRRRRPSARIRIHPTNPDIVYVAALGHPYGAERRARRVQVQATAARPGTRSCSATTRPARSISPWIRKPGRPVRRALGCLSHAAFALERRSRQRPLQDHRRRR